MGAASRLSVGLIVGGVAIGMMLACSGVAVIDPGATTGSGGGGTGGSSCQEHDDCPEDQVCLRSLGRCASECDELSPCPVGEICAPCATSSCPMCDDCLAACVPTEPGQCDDHDDCASGELCIYALQICALACTVPSDCPMGQFCQECVTGSCPSCKDCKNACQ